MVLAIQADVEKLAQIDVTAEPDPVITMLIAYAQTLMETELGRPIESATRTETFDGAPWSLFLHNWPVTAVSTVTEDGTALTVNTEYKWYPTGKLIRISGGYQTWWRGYKPQSIVVAYTGGYPAGKELEHLEMICATVVARAFLKAAAAAALPVGSAGAISSVTLAGSDSVTYADAGGSFSSGEGLNQFVYLEPDEIRQLHLPHFQRPRFGFA